MKSLIDRLVKKEFLKNVIIVMTGTALTQILLFLTTPILTRNYTPDDFGFYTAFIAIYSVLASFTTGKYERAILLLKEKKDIVVVSTLCLLIGGGVSLLVLFVLMILFVFGVEFLNSSSFMLWLLYTMPLFLFFNTLNIVFLTYLNYDKNFKEISKSRIIKTGTTIVISLGCMFFMKNMGGLILGELLGIVFSTLYLYPKLRFLFCFDKEVRNKLKEIAFRYRDFPKFNIPSDALNNMSSQLPVFFLTSAYGTQIAGQYSLMKRILDAPVSLFSSSILEVFRQKASEEYINTGTCRKLFLKTAKHLILISIFPFSMLAFFAPYIFVFLFGEKWLQAGQFASIFALFYFFKFVSSPLSYVFYIAEKQKLDFAIHLYIFFSTLLIFYGTHNYSVQSALWLYVINFIVIYLIYFLLSYKYSRKDEIH